MDVCLCKKNTDPQFTFRSFAQRGGFKSPGILQRIIQGDRNLSESSIEIFAKILELDGEETEFFNRLVHFNQAKTKNQKDHFFNEVEKFRLKYSQKCLDSKQYEFWSAWYYPVIRELVRLPDFKEDPEWISKQIKPSVSIENVEEALFKLQELNLIKRNKEGRLEQVSLNISSGNKVSKTFLRKFHKQMIRKGKESIERFSKEERFLASSTLCLNDEKLNEISDLLKKCCEEIITISSNVNDSDRVVQLNFQLFPLTEIISKRQIHEKN